MNQNDPPPELGSGNPSRPLDWRWQASALPDDQFNAGPAANDQWAIRARAWRRTARARAATPDPRAPGADHRNFLTAFRLRHGGSTVERDALEAALLTGEPSDRVAAFAGVSTAVAEVYGKVFFDVEDRLGDGDWVESAVIGPDRAARHAVWKRVAYCAGLPNLEMAVAVSLGRPLPPDALDRASPTAATVEQWLRAMYANIIKVAAAPPEHAPQLQQQFREWAAANPRPKSRSAEDIFLEATEIVLLARYPCAGRTRAVRLARAVKAMVREAEPKRPAPDRAVRVAGARKEAGE